MEDGPQFILKLEAKVLEVLGKVEFNSGSFHFIGPSLIDFMLLVTTQQSGGKSVSPKFLKQLHGLPQGKLMCHYYLSKAC